MENDMPETTCRDPNPSTDYPFRWELIQQFKNFNHAQKWCRRKWIVSDIDNVLKLVRHQLICIRHVNCEARVQMVVKDDNTVEIYKDMWVDHSHRMEQGFSEESDVSDSEVAPCEDEDERDESPNLIVNEQDELPPPPACVDSHSNSESSKEGNTDTVYQGDCDFSDADSGLVESCTPTSSTSNIQKKESIMPEELVFDYSSDSDGIGVLVKLAPKRKRSDDKCSPIKKRMRKKCKKDHDNETHLVTEEVEGRQIDLVAGVDRHIGVILWLVKFADMEPLTLVRSELMNKHFPQSVINYFQRRITWNENKNDFKVNLDMSNLARILVVSNCDCFSGEG